MHKLINDPDPRSGSLTTVYSNMLWAYRNQFIWHSSNEIRNHCISENKYHAVVPTLIFAMDKAKQPYSSKSLQAATTLSV